MSKRKIELDSDAGCSSALASADLEILPNVKRPHPTGGNDDVASDRALAIQTKNITIPVVPLGISADDIFRYFQSNYGEIECVCLHKISDYHLATVTFGLVNGAEKALRKKQHEIAGRILSVSITDQIRQQFNFMQMNDDCIVKIIELSELMDIWTMANVSIRLRELAQRAFSSKYKNGALDLGCRVFPNLTDFLRIFGSLIQSLQISSLSCETLNSLQEYCESLTSLDVWSSNIEHVSDEDVKLLVPLFSRLQTLKWQKGSIPAKLLEIFSGTELHLTSTKVFNNNAGKMSLNRLKKLIIRDSGHDTAIITNFLNLLNQPKSVEYIEIRTWLGVRLSAYGISNFENVTTLVLFDDNYLSTFEEFIDLVRPLRHLSNLTFKLINIFTPDNLLAVIENCMNLERLIVIYTKIAPTFSSANSEVCGTISNVLSRRPNKNHLNSIFVETRDDSTPFDITLPTVRNLFKITYMSMQTLCSIFKWDEKSASFYLTTLSQQHIEILHDHTMRL